MFEVGDRVKYGAFGYGNVTQVDVNLVTVHLTHDDYNRPVRPPCERTFKPDGKPAGGSWASITLVKKVKPMFDFKSMTLPATLDTNAERLKATIQEISPCGKYAFGITTSELSTFIRVWDQNGNQVWLISPSRPSHRFIDPVKVNLVQPKSEAQKQYESLDADGRGILAALQNNYTASINYIKDKLKVDVNLAQDILNHATKKDYK